MKARAMAMAAYALVALAGCNAVFGLDEPAVGVDGGQGSGWGERQPLTALAVEAVEDQDPFRWGEELFMVGRVMGGATGLDVLVSVQVAGVWAAPTPVDPVNGMGDEATPRLSLDGLRMFFASPRAGTRDIWVSTRVAVGMPWMAPLLLEDAGVNGPAEESGLMECAGGRQVFTSDRNGSGQMDVFEQIGPVVVPVPGASEAAWIEVTPFISADCLTLYFASNRSGPTLDLFVMVRTGVDALWSAPVRIEGLSQDTTHESGLWVSDDGQQALFAVAPMANASDTDVFEASR